MNFLTAPTSVFGSAIFARDGEKHFRYVLTRQIRPLQAPLRLCVWMNPSTADDYNDDASIRIGMSFARRWGDGGIIVINVMDLVLTDSSLLPKDRSEALGPRHWEYVDKALGGEYGAVHKEVMCGWGDAGTCLHSVLMLSAIRKAGLRPMALAITKSGNPGHPLRKSLDSKLVEF